MKCQMELKYLVKSINDNPEKYFTKEVLDKIDEQAKKKFLIRRRIKDMSLLKDLETILVV